MVELAEILNQEIRALWWKQPFASLMLHGKIETRTWDTTYRGYVLICCSQSGYHWSKVKTVSGLHQMSRMRETLMGKGSFHLNGLAIGIGKLTGTQKMDVDDENATYVKYNSGLFCHIYENVIPIVPFKPYEKGQIGWKTIDNYVKDQIKPCQ